MDKTVLTSKQLEVMALTYDGYTARQIAEMLNKTFATIKSARHRARRRLATLGLKMPDIPAQPRKTMARHRASVGQAIIDDN